MGVDATGILILLLAAHLLTIFIQGILDGQHLVHVSSILTPIEWTSRSAVQVALVIYGFGLTGAFVGYFAGAVVAAVIGLYFISVDWSLPSRRDFVHLKSFAQFSWLAPVKGRTFLSMDTLVLALFVSNSLVAVYEIAWNLASLFSLFGSSITKTLFPEMSKISSSKNTNDELSGLLRTGLAYMGLFIIPGLVGSAIIGDIVLTIYGPGFEKGYYILLILTFARLLYGYMGQFTTTLGAIDRPDLTFRINIAFIAANLVLNLILTPPFGWYGAAAATTTSTTVGLLMGYCYTNQHVTVTIPVVPISKQLFAAVVMAISVYLCRLLFGDSLPLAIILAGVGAGIYFLTLITISQEFRTTVMENLPLNTLALLSG
jgi:O-antigen/teichoic acid export membrane protein